MPRDKLLTPGEADAVMRLLEFGWADYDSLSEAAAYAMGLSLEWLGEARRGSNKISARAAKLKRRVESKKQAAVSQPVTSATGDPNAI